jgi:hypothetical protein
MKPKSKEKGLRASTVLLVGPEMLVAGIIPKLRAYLCICFLGKM